MYKLCVVRVHRLIITHTALTPNKRQTHVQMMTRIPYPDMSNIVV
jgi:hypothetical protein